MTLAIKKKSICNTRNNHLLNMNKEIAIKNYAREGCPGPDHKNTLPFFKSSAQKKEKPRKRDNGKIGKLQNFS
jgi:hypothetical protein